MRNQFEVLTENQIQNIHEKSLYVLSHYGIPMKNERALNYFYTQGALIEGNNVKIPVTMVENTLSKIPSSFTIEAKDPKKSATIGSGFPPLLTPCGMPTHIIENTYKRRAATEEDLKNFMKIIHTSDVCNANYPGVVYPKMKGWNDDQITLYQTYTALNMSDKPFLGHSHDLKHSMATIEMASAATGKTSGYYAIGNVSSVSPMHWDFHMLDGLMCFSEKNQPMMIMSCPMAGMSGHIYPENTLLMSNIEILAGMVLSQLVNEGCPVIYGNHAYMADMRTLNLVTGASESTRLYTAAAQLGKFYKIPTMIGGALSDSKDFDVQTGIESTSNIFLNLMSDVDLGFQFFGILDSYNSISYAKWISDEEIVARFKLLSTPMNDVTQEYADQIGTLGENADYPNHVDTKKNYRKAVKPSLISSRTNYDEWLKRKITCQELAETICQKRIEQYDTLSLKNDPDLEKIYKKYLEN